VLHVVLGRPPGDHQAPGDLGVAAPLGDQPEHLHLAVGQPRGQPPAGDHGVVAGRGQHGPDGLGVEASLAGAGQQQPPRLLGSHGGPVRPALGHRLVGVGGRQHPGRHGELGARAAAVVAAAVEPLVVHPDRRPQRRQPLRPGQDPLGVVGVQPDLLPLVGAQGARLLPDRVRDGHPTDVVQQPGQLEVGDGGRREPEPVPGAAGQGGNAGRMPVGEGRLEVRQVGEGGRDLDQQRLGTLGEPGGQLRVQHAAAAPPHRLRGQPGPAGGVEQHRDPGQPGHPRPEREVVAGQAGRGAPAPPLS
jgi:hypothetical protein